MWWLCSFCNALLWQIWVFSCSGFSLLVLVSPPDVSFSRSLWCSSFLVWNALPVSSMQALLHDSQVSQVAWTRVCRNVCSPGCFASHRHILNISQASFWLNNLLPPVFISATASIASPRRLLVILKVKMWLLVVQACTVESPTDSGAGPGSGPVKSSRSVYQRIRFSLRPRLMGGWAIQVSLVRVNHILRLVSEPSPTVAHVHCVHPKWQAHAEGQ